MPSLFDEDVMRAGVATALEAVDHARIPLALLRVAPHNERAVRELDACLHRLSRITATVGLIRISRSAQEVEKALHGLHTTRRGLRADDIDLFEEAIELLEALLSGVDARTGAHKGVAAECSERLKSMASCA